MSAFKPDDCLTAGVATYSRFLRCACQRAGAVHSPHILMLSGIGPRSHLEEQGISRVVVDLPGVGQHLRDHPIVDTMWRLRSGSLEYTKPDTGLWPALRTSIATTWWFLTGRGPMSSNVSDVRFGRTDLTEVEFHSLTQVTESAAFLRSDDERLLSRQMSGRLLEDSSSGPGAPDLEIICCPFAIRRHGEAPSPGGEIGSMAAVLLRSAPLALSSCAHVIVD